MDDTFLQDEEPTFQKATLEINNGNFVKSQSMFDLGFCVPFLLSYYEIRYKKQRPVIDIWFLTDVKDNQRTHNVAGTVPITVPGIPYARIDCHTFFSDRNEVVEKALEDCKRDLLSSTEEEELVGSWMLTEYALFILQNFSHEPKFSNLLINYWLLYHIQTFYKYFINIGITKT